MGVDWHVLVVEVELRAYTCEVYVRLIEGFYGSNVLPKAIEQERCHLAVLDGVRDYLLAKVGLVIVEDLLHGLCGEDVDAHGCKVFVGFVGLDS